jgi:hypothetical protein
VYNPTAKAQEWKTPNDLGKPRVLTATGDSRRRRVFSDSDPLSGTRRPFFLAQADYEDVSARLPGLGGEAGAPGDDDRVREGLTLGDGG